MISVVCVYSSEEILKDVLLRSLDTQTVKFELITLDNRDNRYTSAAEALNYGGGKAKGEYIMFVHQDLWLGSHSLLEDVEDILKSLPHLGVAGVAGMSEKGRSWEERVKFSVSAFDEACYEEIDRVAKPEEVQTLDECLLIVPGPVFSKLQFDEKVFDGWDCYGADYCLSVKQLGFKVYVIPASCSHSHTRRRAHQIWEFKGLLKYQKKLYAKHRKNYKTIHTWMEEVSWLNLRWRELSSCLGPPYLRLFPTFPITLKRELSGCNTVLDLGCGYGSPLQLFNIPFSVGVELFEPYLQESRRRGIHSQYIRADIRRVEFSPRSFDAVIAVEVLEHLTKQEGAELLGRMEQWARKKVIVATPNGCLCKGTYDNNPLQEHKSGWHVKELRGLGFKVFGIAGWKGLRGHKALIKYRPAFLWMRISDLTQKITYHYPKLAFQLLAVKRIDQANRR